MVVYTNASSPKRPQPHEAQATAHQLAQANVTLRAFTDARHNASLGHMHRMQDPLALSHRGEGAMTSALGNGNSNSSRRDAASRVHETARADYPSDNRADKPPATRPPAENVNTPTAARSSTAHPAAQNSSIATSCATQPGLFNYESSSIVQLPTPMTAAAALQSRPPSATTPHSSLASPVASEEHAAAPRSSIFIPEQSGPRPLSRAHSKTHSQVSAKRPRGRPRKHPLINTQDPGSLAFLQSSRAVAHGMVDPTTPVQFLPNIYVPAPTTQLEPSPANSPAHANNVAHLPQQNLQSALPQRPPSADGLFSMSVMQQRLHDFFEPRAQAINQIDQGRRMLVQEAIEKEDFFYLTLSQIFCLHTCRPQLMPKQLERIHPSSWVFLERLLCSNQAMSPWVLQWFSEFPAPVHTMSAGGESLFFMNQLVVVESFLHELPRRWDHIVNLSKHRSAPPLTQDMVEQLYLISPVIQTTAFRAIARSFWGGQENSGLRFLESLHKTDQHTYTFQQWRRSEAEKNVAYGVYARVLSAWTQQQQQQQQEQQNPARQGADGFDFIPPLGCDYFGQLPPSMKQGSNADINNQNQQVSRSTAQQLQMIEMNQRIFGQRQAVPALSEERQQRSLGEQSGTIARQGAPPRSVHPLSHKSNPPLQPRPSTQHSPVALSSTAPLHHRSAPHIAACRPPNYAAPHLSRLLPPENALPRPLPVQPDTARVSLHQAHLRSPIPARQQPLAEQHRLYRHVTGYALAPTQLDTKLCAQTITLSMLQADLDKIPSIEPGSLPGEPGIRNLKEGSDLYRLRCSKMPPEKGFDTEASWVTAENVWPDTLTFQVNGKYLEARRKLHHGRCLPIDLSSLLHAGINTINVYTLPSRHDRNAYVIAVERVGVSSHASILASITRISASDSLATIKRSLESRPADDEDDVAVTSSTLTIPLFDPYRADRFCQRPVRGSACLHRECADLETFLSQCRREQPGYPCVPDCWRCPICKGDARPQTLVEDGFLLKVKEELVAKGLLDTRTIVVEADGSWKPRVEEQPSGVRSASLEREEAAAAAAMAAAANSKILVVPSAMGKQKVVEVIELD